MVKFLGLVLAFAASSAIGFYKAGEIKKRKAMLLDFKETVLKLSTEISYFKEPLPQIFHKLSDNQNTDAAILLAACLLRYRTTNKPMDLIWQEAAEEIYYGTPLTREDIEVIKKCGQFLGQSDYERQREHFELLNYQLDKQLADAEEAIKTKGKMYGKMGISVGLVIAIVFI